SPPGRAFSRMSGLSGRGHCPCHSATLILGPRPAPAGSGAGLLLFLNLPVYRAPSRAGGGNALRFLIPSEGRIPFPGSGSVSRQPLRPARLEHPARVGQALPRTGLVIERAQRKGAISSRQS
ncbi:MAG: hypothetical protein ACK446_03895, partial [Rhodobacterales bacterium]